MISPPKTVLCPKCKVELTRFRGHLGTIIVSGGFHAKDYLST